jgi:outer membrane receptor protein involved in Fe transport
MALAIVIGAGWPAFARAQMAAPETEAQAGIEEIVVTAQRRSERLQDVPIAITAITSSRLEASGIANSSDLAVLTPALTAPNTQNYFQPRIRGVGTLSFGPGIENAIATYVDGVYIASAPASVISFADIERVEVLKGPQGTLFGRNATGGLIQIITRDPGPGLNGSVNAGYGNYGAFTTNGYVSGGSDAVAGDLAVLFSDQDKGYGHNFATHDEANRPIRDIGVRSKILFSPTDTTTIRLSGDYTASSGSYPTTRQYSKEPPLFGAPTPGGPWDANNDFPSRNRFSGGGGSLRVDQDIGEMRLTSITAYRKSRYYIQLDYDGTPTPALTVQNTQRDDQFSQELQLSSRPGRSIPWVVGVYYFNAKGSYDPALVRFFGPTVNPLAPVTAARFAGTQKSESEAAFGQITVPLGGWHLTGGLRYTTERRSLDATQTVTIANLFDMPSAYSNQKRFDKLTWRAAIDRKITPDAMLYATWDRGFKSGGYNVLSPADAAYQPEVLDAYEGGMKAELFDRTLRLNPAVFYYDYKNLQVPFFTSTGQVGIANGPSATLYGLDLDFEYVPVRALRIYGGLSLIHDRFGSYPNALFNIPRAIGGNIQTTGDATGHQLPFTSKVSGNLGATYTVSLAGGDLALSGNVYRNSGFFGETDNLRRQDAYQQISASIGWSTHDERFSINVWGKNLTNDVVLVQLSGTQQGVGASYQPPRTYGVTVGSKFGKNP